jgi:FMN phosphatase YigB (HAD superfamily)
MGMFSPSNYLEQMVKVALFDVYDTLFVRAAGSPSSLFLMLGNKLKNLSLIACTPEAFARARIEAEHRALINKGCASIDHIYDELQLALSLTDEQRGYLLKLEYQLEEEMMRRVPSAVDYVDAARAQGQRVVFLSDTSLASQFIQKQLVHHGFWKENDRCFASCENKKTKASGELFLDIVNAEGVSPQVVLHTGNGHEADILPAKRCGLRVRHLPEGNLNRYEEILESYIWHTEGLSSVMAAASRLARLTVSASGAKEQVLRDVAASVVAPILTGYVLWVINRAGRLGLKRLYFTSRDGQILLDIAKILVRKLDISCELRYLYGSRLSWNLPAMKDLDEEWLWRHEGDSINHVLARLGIGPNQIESSLESIGFKKKEWYRPLSQCEAKILRGVLQERENESLILEQATKRKRYLLEYLREEGLFDPVPKGLVDLVGQGSMYRALARIFTQMGKKEPAGFYFFLGNSLAKDNYDLLEAYYFDERFGIGSRDGWLGPPLELFCTADHGTVLAFENNGANVRPILEEERNQRAVDWGLAVVRKTVCSFAENIILDCGLVNPYADVRKATAKTVELFWRSPSRNEAIAWGELPWEDHGMGTYRVPIAQRYHLKHVLSGFTRGKVVAHHEYAWVAGSVALTPRSLRRMLTGAIRLRSILKRGRRKIARFARTLRGRMTT